MAEVGDMYRFVSLVRDCILAHEASSDGKLGTYSLVENFWYLHRDKAIQQYVDDYKVTSQEAQTLCEDCINSGYLSLKVPGGYHSVTPTTQGRRLLKRSLGIPYRKWESQLEEVSRLSLFLFSALSLIGTVVALVISVIALNN